MLLDFTNGQTSVVLRVKLRQDNTGAKPGQGFTGATNSSTGLIISTIADNEAAATVYTSAATHIQTIATLGTYAAPSASNCRFKEVDATNHPGLVELQFADARFAVASAKELTITISGVSGMADCDAKIPLRSVNPYATSFGLSLAKTTNITGFNDIAAPTGFAASTFPSGTVASTTNITAGTITTTTNLTNLPAIPNNWLTAAGIASAALNGKGDWSTYAGGDTSGTMTLLARLTATRAGYLDNLSAGAVATASQIPANFTSATFASAGVFSTSALANAPTGGTPPTAAAIATAVWQDTTASSDFSTAGSIGLLLKTDVNAQLSTLALASQIPAHFTNATFSADGVFAAAALVNGPGGSGGAAANALANVVSVNGTTFAGANVPANVIEIDGITATPYDGLAQAGTTTTCQLDATTAVAVDGIYDQWRWTANVGTGAGQWAIITGYVGSTKQATFDRTLATAPDATTGYFLDPPIPAELTPTGLDAITTTEPDTTTDGAVSTWNFRKLLRWGVSALSNGTRTLTAGTGTLKVKKLGGAQSTTQNITDDGAGNETLGAPT